VILSPTGEILQRWVGAADVNRYLQQLSQVTQQWTGLLAARASNSPGNTNPGSQVASHPASAGPSTTSPYPMTGSHPNAVQNTASGGLDSRRTTQSPSTGAISGNFGPNSMGTSPPITPGAVAGSPPVIGSAQDGSALSSQPSPGTTWAEIRGTSQPVPPGSSASPAQAAGPSTMPVASFPMGREQVNGGTGPSEASGWQVDSGNFGATVARPNQGATAGAPWAVPGQLQTSGSGLPSRGSQAGMPVGVSGTTVSTGLPEASLGSASAGLPSGTSGAVAVSGSGNTVAGQASAPVAAGSVPANQAVSPQGPLPAGGAPPLGFDGYCPVQLAESGRWVPGNPQWGVIHEGRTYYLAGPAERAKFAADPLRYAPVLSGYDVVLAVEQGLLVPGKREFGGWYRGRVYLFASEETLRQFDRDPEAYLGKLGQLGADGPAPAAPGTPVALPAPPSSFGRAITTTPGSPSPSGSVPAAGIWGSPAEPARR
jgi:YHS domain-containing protein